MHTNRVKYFTMQQVKAKLHCYIIMLCHNIFLSIAEHCTSGCTDCLCCRLFWSQKIWSYWGSSSSSSRCWTELFSYLFGQSEKYPVGVVIFRWNVAIEKWAGCLLGATTDTRNSSTVNHLNFLWFKNLYSVYEPKDASTLRLLVINNRPYGNKSLT